MSKLIVGVAATASVVAVVGLLVARPGGAQAPAAQVPAPPRGNIATPVAPVYASDDRYLRVELAPEDAAYAAIDGKRIKQDVSALGAISRRYRDAGHQFWGRIIGTQADDETAEWMAGRLRDVGAVNVRVQSIPLPAQWMPQSWEVVASGQGKTVSLDSAFPAYQSAGTTGSGLDLEAVYLGLGAEADFKGRDVRGKAAFLYSMPMLGSHQRSAAHNGGVERAAKRGALAVFEVIELPGNIMMSLHKEPADVPTFALGSADGAAIRELIESAPSGQPARVKLRLDVKMVEGLHTANVWGEIRGTGPEDVLVVAHRDAFFEGASDNASGVATALALAEYYAKVPAAKRGRTLRIAGTPGHHNNLGGSIGVRWIADHRDTELAKTALVINAEHTSHVLVDRFGPNLQPTNAVGSYMWGVNGSSELLEISERAFDRFGITRWVRMTGGLAEISRIIEYVPASLGLIHAGVFYHSDAETADTIPAAGLEASTRAYAKIIDDTNRLEIKGLASSAPSTGP